MSATPPRLQPRRLQAPPAGGLDGLIHACRDLPGLACVDLGQRWTVTTWGAVKGACFQWRVEEEGDWRPGLRAALATASRSPRTGGLPFCSGWVGWLGYEAGACCERMPAPAGPRLLPDVALWRCDGAVVWDRHRDTWWLTGDAPFVAQARERLAASRTPPAARPALPPPGLPWRTPTDRRYRTAVSAALDDIRRGWIYQVNLAWAASGTAPADPVAAWLRLRAENPALRGALLRGPDQDGHATWVISNSPERYLDLDAGGRVVSTPIKGTARRQGAGAEGARRALRRSEKERAELTMIADLVRNDLGRVAVPGSVRAGPRQVTACGDLWHATQSVRAQLTPGLDAVDLVSATFPPGSVTGAPKVAAMDRIGRAEDQARGVYTGCHGLWGDDGSLHLAVAIRVAQIRGQRAVVHVGAGIVADSEPLAEWEETLAKGRTLARYVLEPRLPEPPDLESPDLESPDLESPDLESR